MAYRQSWERFVRMALEPTYAGAPDLGAYNEQGKYYAAPTTSPIGALRPIKSRLRTIGTHGRRTADQLAPIPAAEKSEGGLDMPFAGDFGGVLLRAGMGGLKWTERFIQGNVADAANPLDASTPLGPSPTTISLGAQPTVPARLEFIIDDNVVAGTIVVTGTDIADAPLVETINISIHTAAFKYVTVNVFKTVGIGGVVVTGPTAGTLITNGFAPLESSAVLGPSPTTISLNSQPTTAAILEFVVDDNVVAGTIVVTGMDPDDEPLTETINIGIHATPWRYFTKNAFKTVDASGVVITGPTAGTVIIHGWHKFEHTFILADTQPSVRIEEYGDAGADGTNSWFFTGLLIESLGLAFDVSADDGLLVASPQFQGQFPTAAAKSTYQLPARRAYPAWTALVTRDGGAYARLMNMSMQLGNNARPIRTAQGVVSPTQPTFGARTLQGQMRILTEDNNEFTQFTEATLAAILLTFTTPYHLGGGFFEVLVLTMSEIFLETYESGDEQGLIAASLGFYSKEHVSNNALVAKLTNNVHDYDLT